MIKIRLDNHLGTSVDCVSAYTAHFEQNPTLMEFVEFIKENRKGDFGRIETSRGHIEYKHGNLVKNTFQLNDFSRTIELCRIEGGYSRMDYLIKFVNADWFDDKPVLTGYKNDEKDSRKDDRKDGKPMWQLFPFAELSGVVDVYTAGAKKYGENRWQNLEDGEQRYFGAFCRHWVEHLRGNEIDPEDGCLHLDKTIWNLIAVRHCFLASKGIDPSTTNYEKLWK